MLVAKADAEACYYYPLDQAEAPPEEVSTRHAKLAGSCVFGVLEAATFEFVERDLDAYLAELPDIGSPSPQR